MSRVNLKIALGYERLEPLHQVLDLKLLASPKGTWATRNLLRWDEHVADDLDHTVLGDAILDRNATKAVDLNADEAAISSDVNAKAAILEHGRKVNVEVALGDTLLAASRATASRSASRGLSWSLAAVSTAALGRILGSVPCFVDYRVQHGSLLAR